MAKMSKQDIFEMEGNWRTLMREQNRHMAVAKLAEGIKNGSYLDLWGPSMIATTLWSEGDEEAKELARSLLPFWYYKVENQKNPDAQFAFAAFAAER